MRTALDKHKVQYQRILCALTLVFLLGAASACLQSQSVAKPTTSTIYGYVTDITGAIVPNATVSLEADGRITQQTKTDKGGHFAIESEPGDYVFKVVAQGFFTYDVAIHLNDSSTIRKHVVLNVGYCSPCVQVLDSSGHPITPLPINTHNTAALSGTIVDASGASIPRANVELDANGKPVLWITVNGAGHFEANVPPGNYIQNVTAPGFRTYSQPIHLIENTSLRKDIVLQLANCEPCGVVFTPTPPLMTFDTSLKAVLPFNRLPPFKTPHIRRPLR